MSHYISSSANRFYVAIESAYGIAAPVTAASRFPAVRLAAQQTLESVRRLDKTGGRTFLGTPSTARRHTAFQARTYLTSWSGMGQPSYGPLFQAALGAAPIPSDGLTIAAAPSGTALQTTTPHGLSAGCSVAVGNEIRFVSSVIDSQTVTLNAPYGVLPTAGTLVSPSVTYTLTTQLPSVTMYDYWDPITAVSRVVVGGGVDVLEILVNGDIHEFTFGGPAADLIDSSSFSIGSAGLSTYPVEPSLAPFDYSIVPGHLGQVWLGSPANEFFTLTTASIEVKNNLATRDNEFGSSYPRSIAPGPRDVTTKFTVFAQDDSQTVALYQAAKQRIPIAAMLQLGQQQGQIMGIYMPKIVPEIPHYDDSESRLRWQFTNNLAQGTSNDELYIAFA